MLKFDAEVTRLLDNAYQGQDFTRRRQASFDALRPNPGEIILDIGCGNGLLTAELARAVGQDGRVIGVERKTAISIAHQVNSIARLDCIIFLDQGRILEDGNHFELLERDGLYARYCNRHSGEFIDTEKPEAAE